MEMENILELNTHFASPVLTRNTYIVLVTLFVMCTTEMRKNAERFVFRLSDSCN